MQANRPPGQDCWRVEDTRQLVIADFDDGIAVYDRRSSRTHVLKDVAAEIFLALSERPQTVADLHRMLEPLLDTAETDLGETVEDIVAGLRTLNLVEATGA